MSVERALAGADVVQLTPHVRLRFDQTRQQWVINAPERVFELDTTAAEILRRLDGSRSLAAIVDELAREFDAPHAVIHRDVIALLEPLLGKGVVRR